MQQIVIHDIDDPMSDATLREFSRHVRAQRCKDMWDIVKMGLLVLLPPFAVLAAILYAYGLLLGVW